MDSLYPVEFLHTLQFSGIANHEVELKVGVPILLLCNLNQLIGLCNGTRLIVKRLGQRVIEAEIIIGNNVDECVFIPRIIMSPSRTDWPFVLRRRRFLYSCGVCDHNQQESKSDIQQHWGIFAISDLFPWSAVCCYFTVISSANIKIFNGQGPDRYMRNVVYKEVLEL